MTRIRSALAQIGLVLTLAAMATPAMGQKIVVDELMPSFSGTELLTGKPIKIEDFRGKVVLIDFWATWCVPCIQELPNVRAAYEKYRDKGFEIISISLDSDAEKCRDYVQNNQMPWLHIADGGGWKAEIAQKFGIRAIPAMYVLDRNGVVHSAKARGSRLEAAIEEALAVPIGATPRPKAADDDIERDAQAELAAADKLRDSGRYAEALLRYDEIGTEYLGRNAAHEANKRAKALRDDKSLADKIAKQMTELKAAKNGGVTLEGEDAKKADRWLTLARSFARQDNKDMARKYYQKVIDAYANSAQARTAEQEMAKLEG
jgi:thiol-disulfide isomerase/thioredoxin